MTRRLRLRTADAARIEALRAAGAPGALARLLAARDAAPADVVTPDLGRLLSPAGLRGIEPAAALLADAIDAKRAILVVADYDCDGATACAVAVLGLRSLGARVDYLVPNRFEHGYGLTPPIVDLALAHPRLPDASLLVTVDNGIASFEGVAHARARGLSVLVTDHHLPQAGAQPPLPAANAIVNPNQPGCGFASKALAGVGVMFYVLLALRAEQRRRGRWPGDGGPPLQALLDLVALGTVADLVPLDANNRLLVAAGLRRMRAGQSRPGVLALLRVAGREPAGANAEDLGFAVGPRINAAGRLEDISLGIETLLTDDPLQAAAFAQRLDTINRQRRTLQADMSEAALAQVALDDAHAHVCTVFDPGWHEGVVGLVASRLKDLHHRPSVAFAPSALDAAVLRGSGRSIPGVHLRDALDLVAKRLPGAILRFGGHAMAAGLTLARDAWPSFGPALDQAVAELADPGAFSPTLDVDGPLPPGECTLGLVEAIDRQVWGQGFPAPVFVDAFEVAGQRLLKERHLAVELVREGGTRLRGVYFGRSEPLPDRVTALWRPVRNDWNGVARLEARLIDVVDPG